MGGFVFFWGGGLNGVRLHLTGGGNAVLTHAAQMESDPI